MIIASKPWLYHHLQRLHSLHTLKRAAVGRFRSPRYQSVSGCLPSTRARSSHQYLETLKTPSLTLTLKKQSPTLPCLRPPLQVLAKALRSACSSSSSAMLAGPERHRRPAADLHPRQTLWMHLLSRDFASVPIPMAAGSHHSAMLPLHELFQEVPTIGGLRIVALIQSPSLIAPRKMCASRRSKSRRRLSLLISRR